MANLPLATSPSASSRLDGSSSGAREAQGSDMRYMNNIVHDLPPNIVDLNKAEVLACMGWDITAYHRVQVVKLARHFHIAYHPQTKTHGVQRTLQPTPKTPLPPAVLPPT